MIAILLALSLGTSGEPVLTQDTSGEPALTQAGCERLLMKCPHADAKKLLLFLQRECFKPYAKKRGEIPA